jgi:hypothetical protein
VTPNTTASRTPIVVHSPTPRPTNTPQPPTNTPPASSTPEPTRTLIPTATRYATGTPTPSLTAGPGTPTVTPGAPPQNPETENEAEWEILSMFNQFFGWGVNTAISIFDFISNLVNWLIGTILNFFSLLGALLAAIVNFIGSILRFLAELFDIARLIVEIILGFLRLLAAYIQQILLRIGALLQAFYAAPPQPIPGLPLCVTNPTAYDICAIYYIFDWTLLAPATPGALIIPLIMVIMNVNIVILFVRFVLRMIRRGESITNVG